MYELKSIILPTNLKRIGTCAFCDTGLTSVTIPKGVEDIRENPFDRCYNLEKIDVDGINDRYRSVEGILLKGNDELCKIVQFPKGKRGDYIIPDCVLDIYENTFSNSHSLTSIFISSAVIDIEPKSFYGCSSLTSINVSEDNEFFKSVDGVLFDLDGSTLHSFPQAGSGRYSIPFGTELVQEYAFSGCSGLTSVSIPSSVRDINQNAFEGCSGLSELTIESGLKYIWGFVFSGCTSLKSITLPSSVTQIDEYAFSGCTNLDIVSYLGDRDPCVSDDVFEGCDNIHHICVPLDFSSVDGTFAGMKEFCVTDSCSELHFEGDGPCYEEGCYEGKFFSQMRREIKDLEIKLKNSACVDYYCDNETGINITKACGIGYLCVNDACKLMHSGYVVEIDVERVRIDEFSTFDMVEQISQATGITITEIGLDLDENGYILRIVIPVSDSQTGQNLAKKMNDFREQCV